MDSPIYYKEDTSKPENRTNLALFSILMIPEIHSFVCDRLKLPKDVIIFPCPNLAEEEFNSRQRPDFCIKKSYPFTSQEIGYIEVELGKEDQAQLQGYRTELNTPIYSIVGKKNYFENGRRGILSLEEIYDLASEIKRSYSNTQQCASLELFCSLVKYYVIDGNFHSSTKRTDISETTLSSRLIKEIYNYFGKDNILRNTRPKHGKILLNACGGQYGFSLRVYCTKTQTTKNGGFSLMHRTTSKPKITKFPSLRKLRKYFPDKEEETKYFADIIAQLGAEEIYHLKEKELAELPIKMVEENFGRIGDAIRKFL